MSEHYNDDGESCQETSTKKSCATSHDASVHDLSGPMETDSLDIDGEVDGAAPAPADGPATKKPRKTMKQLTPLRPSTEVDYLHVVVDLEKCNSNPWLMSLTNLAAICWTDNSLPKQIGEVFDKLSCPPSSVPFTPLHERLTKITRKHVEGAAAPDVVLREFIAWIEACVVLRRQERLVSHATDTRPIHVCIVGHNVAACDLDLFFNSFKHYQIPIPECWTAYWYFLSPYFVLML